ncbi:MAG TPA: S-methyl-5'-thioadenosine phosphorylase [Thermoplasmata archaeon]|nr:S-methyl-5'-thioadenosine phosphorylase [Thermoplasmata archaeon]
MTAAPIGVIGGSGVTSLFGTERRSSHRVGTPWGAPSGPIESGSIGGTPVLFLARHGPDHTIPPHRVNYRANIDALRSLGAETILALNSVGSLKEDLPPGTFVLPDQFVDWTKQRPTTFYDGGQVHHVSLADPFCPRLLKAAERAGRARGHPFVPGKTYVCVEGPRFSTRAESRLFRTFADVIGMTLVPEATLARERALCYVCLAMVTDFDVWAEHPVEADQIVRTMRENVGRMGEILSALIPEVAGARSCPCSTALDRSAL